MNQIKSIVVSVLGSALFLAAVAPLHAASECKGLEQNTCADKAQCRWIAAYKRSDGRDVSGYCRALPASDGKPKLSRAETT